MNFKRVVSAVLFFSTISIGLAQFQKDNKLYFFRDADGIPFGPTYLSYVDNYTTSNPVIVDKCLMNLPAITDHNALGANYLDGFLYYVQNDSGTTSSRVYRLDQNCISTYLFTLPFVTIAGCFDNKGRYWVIQNTPAKLLYAYDINTHAQVKGPFNLGTTSIMDIAYNIYECNFYYGDYNSINVLDTNGVVQSTQSPGFVKNLPYGGTAIGSDGRLYGFTNVNSNSHFCYFDVNTGASDTLFSITPGVPQNGTTGSDMASFSVLDTIKANASITYSGQCGLPAVVTFSDSTKGKANTWAWDFGDGSTSALQSPTHAYTTSGTFTVTLIASNSGTFCIPIIPDTTTKVVTILPALSVSSVSRNVSCYGTNTGSVQITVSTGTMPYTFAWSNGGTTNSITGLATGNYYAIVTDANGCSIVSYFNITQPTPLSVTTTNDTTICSGQPVNISVTPTGGNGNYTFSWTPGTYATSSIITSPLITTTFITTVNDGCTSITNSIVVTVNELPVISFTANDTAGCAPLCVTFSASSSQPVNTYAWDFGNSSTSNLNSPTNCYTTAGQYDVSLTIVDVKGCSASLTRNKFINVFPAVTAAFTATPGAAMVNQTISFDNLSTGATQWQWNFNNGTSNSTQENPFYSYDQSGSYIVKLVASNIYGCMDSTTNEIIIVPDFTFYAPNAFTPDGNNTNETFKPNGSGFDTENYELMIFDRWGNLLFTTNDYNLGWNGRVNDAPAQIDTYVWKVKIYDFLGIRHNYIGSVSLIK